MKRQWHWALGLKACLLAYSLGLGSAWAEEFPFGGSAEDEFKKGFAEEQGITEREKTGTERDRLRIGGTLLSEFWYYNLSGGSAGNFFTQPNTLWGYGDAALRNDVRAFVKGRLIFDPTANSLLYSPLTGLAGEKYRPVLEELKLMFSAEKTVFFTIGKQKIKWGSARFWNPTDFVNTIKRPLLRPEDEREGVTLIKSHVPIRSSNFYLIQILDDATKLQDIGMAARAEVAFESSEFALSLAAKKGRKAVIGADASFGLWDFDVYSELSYSKGSDVTFFRAVNPLVFGVPFQGYRDDQSNFFKSSSGITYEVKYNDTDTVTFGLEYFFNGEGYGDRKEYPAALLGGGYFPFYFGKHYGMFSIFLPQPLRNKNLTINLFNLLNGTDGSALTRLDTGITVLQDILWTISLGGHYGNPSGEFKLGGQTFDVATTFKVNF